MLILTCKPEQTICIGKDIKIHILGVAGNCIKIGIDAPKNIEVHRGEIFIRIQAEKKTIAHETDSCAA